MHEWIVSLPARLDVFLTGEGAATSRVKARDVIKAGCVMVNGRIARKAALVLKEGDKVEMSATEEPVTETRIESLNLKVEVLYEDDACMVVNKPAGLSVHPGAGMPLTESTLLNGIVYLFAERKIPFSSSAVLVHRLDKETTGCLLVAKTAAAHKELQKQFEDRTVKKIYLAIVAGIPDPPMAMIDASIGRSTANRTKMTVFGSAKTRDARTTYKTLDASDETALLACELHTGRTHQIRVHLHSIGHSILGDDTYMSALSEDVQEKYAIHDLCLHAWQITFISPVDKKEHMVQAPVSTVMNESLNILGLKIATK